MNKGSGRSSKFINYLSFTDFLAGYYIHPFEPDTAVDLNILNDLLKATIKSEERIFIIFSSNDKTVNSEIIQTQLSETGKLFHFFDEHSPENNYCICENFNPTFMGRLLKYLWAVSRELKWFVAKEEIKWDNFLLYKENIFQPDPEGKKLLIFDFADFVFLKGLGGESLSINHKRSYSLPDIQEIVLRK